MANPRADYLPIIGRPPLKLPGGGRIIVLVVINVEDWDVSVSLGDDRNPSPLQAKNRVV